MDAYDAPEYGETGFIPTVDSSTYDERKGLVLHTIDEREERDIVLRDGEHPALVEDLATEEQQEVLRLINR